MGCLRKSSYSILAEMVHGSSDHTHPHTHTHTFVQCVHRCVLGGWLAETRQRLTEAIDHQEGHRYVVHDVHGVGVPVVVLRRRVSRKHMQRIVQLTTHNHTHTITYTMSQSMYVSVLPTDLLQICTAIQNELIHAPPQALQLAHDHPSLPLPLPSANAPIQLSLEHQVPQQRRMCNGGILLFGVDGRDGRRVVVWVMVMVMGGVAVAAWLVGVWQRGQPQDLPGVSLEVLTEPLDDDPVVRPLKPG